MIEIAKAFLNGSPVMQEGPMGCGSTYGGGSATTDTEQLNEPPPSQGHGIQPWLYARSGHDTME